MENTENKNVKDVNNAPTEKEKKKRRIIIIILIFALIVALFCAIFFPCCNAYNNRTFKTNLNVTEGPTTCLTLTKNESKYSEDYETDIVLDVTKSSGYVMPDTLTKVTSGNAVLTDGQFTYSVNADKNRANFKIIKNNIKGDVDITIALVYATPINASFTVEGGAPASSIKLSKTSIKRNEDYVTEITLDESKSDGYLLDTTLAKVTTGNATLAADKYEYSVNAEGNHANFKILNANISGDIVITIKTFKSSDFPTFTFNGTNCTLNNESRYPKGTDVTLNLNTTLAMYAAPQHIALRKDGIVMTEGSDYTYTIDPNDDTKATLTVTVNANITVEALAVEKGLALSLTVEPKAGENTFGFCFQCIPDNPADPHPENKSIFVDWGDGSDIEEIQAVHNIDDVIAPGGPTSGQGMFGYVAQYGGSYDPDNPPPLPNTPDLNRHEFEPGTYNVRIFGELNSIAFGFPNPYDSKNTFPWGYANKYITSVTTYVNLPANNVTSSLGGQVIGRNFDTYVVLGHPASTSSVEFALGTTKIANGCLLKCRELKEVIIPDTVTEIGEEAFCEAGIEEIDIPDSVITIGKRAFQCADDTPAQLASGINISPTSNLKTIGEEAFLNSGVLDFFVPKNVENIFSSAFNRCKNLATVRVDGENPYYKSVLGSSECNAIITKKEVGGLEANTLVIGTTSSTTVPFGIVAIGNYAFHYRDIDSIDALPDSLTSIGISAFRGCTRITSITIPSSVTTIADEAFFNCNELATVDLTFFNDPNNIPTSYTDTFKNVSDDVKFRVINDTMRDAFRNKGGGWPSDPSYYTN